MNDIYLTAKNPLQEKLENIRPELIAKNWHISNTPHISASLTGLVKKRKTKTFEPRNQMIVGIWNIHSIDADGQRRLNMWEVKTHWTVIRHIFDDFESAWEMFRAEEEKYHPDLLNWQDIENQEKR